MPASAVPLYYLGLRYGWWGDGVGDGAWALLAAFLTVVAVAGCAVVIGVLRLARRQ